MTAIYGNPVGTAPVTPDLNKTDPTKGGYIAGSEKIGDLEKLKTKNKNSLVDAINEATETGSSIYIGSGDMPEGYDVQINPEGEPIDLDSFTTDEELAKAIAEALEGFEPPASGITEDQVSEMIAEALGGIVNGSY